MKKIKFGVLIITIYFLSNLFTAKNSFLLNRSIENQIAYLSDQIENGEDDYLQIKYPEGKTFANALLALSIIDLSARKKYNTIKYLEIVEKCISRLLSEKNKAHYNSELNPKYGAFYLAWTNFVLKKYIESNLYQKSNQKRFLDEQHHELSSIIHVSILENRKLLETYSESVWPTDNLVCIASIKDNFPESAKLLKDLLLASTEHPQSSIIHSIDQPNEIRGSSQALAIYFMNQLDEKITLQENIYFKKALEQNILGIRLVKEYEGFGEADVDSGPILIGFGSVASIMNIKTQANLSYKYSMTWGMMNMLGMPINFMGKKYYLFKQEMMFDLFMLWTAVELEKN